MIPFTQVMAFTVRDAVVLLQPVVVLLKVKVAVPGVIPLTAPALVMVATASLLLVQVPPVAGLTVVVCPVKMDALPVKLTAGRSLTTAVVVAGALEQPPTIDLTV